ncbi:hypothetical protein MUY35_04880 [Aliiroseovarius sp. S1339]|uniref:hypothetical protein n=1 Tax=Aliiroseovarius sp. S1339 TaxID=2936990 RepID=UPI0020BE2F1C|nr:hypothetical protein [Aliiroseovarius sp. S1339]MCK8463182.1 hypothetical protein [Aliiroseovarius sp. S1339]
MKSELEQIQDEIEAERALLEQELAALNDHVSVESLTAEAGQYIRDASGDVANKLMARFGQNAQAHPLAVAAVGAGLSWLMSGPTPSANPEPVMRRSMGAYNGPKPAAGDPDLDTPVTVAAHLTLREPDLTEKVQARAKGAIETAQDHLSDLRKQAADMRSRIAEGTEDLSAEARARVVAAREKALEAAQKTGRKVRDAGQVSTDFAKENPMVVGGIALALGAAVAGALYMRKSAKTDDEDEFERLDAFAQADRTFEDEVALARTERNTAVQGKKDS